MFRDTTPELTFELPFDTSLITDAGVTIAQKGAEVPAASLAAYQAATNYGTIADQMVGV